MRRIHKIITLIALVADVPPAYAASKVCYDTNQQKVVPCHTGWEEPAEESAGARLQREPWRKLPIWDEFENAQHAHYRGTGGDLSLIRMRNALKPFALAHRDELRELALAVLPKCLGDEKTLKLCANSNGLSIIPFARYVLRPEDAPLLEKLLSSDIRGVRGDVGLVDALAMVTNRPFFDLLSRYLVGGDDAMDDSDQILLWQFLFAPRNAALNRYAAEVSAFLHDHPKANARGVGTKVLLILQYGNDECLLERERQDGVMHMCDYLCPHYGLRPVQVAQCKEFVPAAEPALWNGPPALRDVASEGPWPYP